MFRDVCCVNINIMTDDPTPTLPPYPGLDSPVGPPPGPVPGNTPHPAHGGINLVCDVPDAVTDIANGGNQTCTLYPGQIAVHVSKDVPATSPAQSTGLSPSSVGIGVFIGIVLCALAAAVYKGISAFVSRQPDKKPVPHTEAEAFVDDALLTSDSFEDALAPSVEADSVDVEGAVSDDPMDVAVHGTTVTFPTEGTAAVARALLNGTSSLTEAVRSAGYDVSNSVNAEIGKAVAPSDLREGDVIVAHGSDSVYLGQGKALVAGTHAVVSVSDVADFREPGQGMFRLVEPSTAVPTFLDDLPPWVQDLESD